MASKESFNNTAKDILVCVGEKENVISVAHCATRLRFVLHDNKKIEEINLVRGCFYNGGNSRLF